MRTDLVYGFFVLLSLATPTLDLCYILLSAGLSSHPGPYYSDTQVLTKVPNGTESWITGYFSTVSRLSHIFRFCVSFSDEQ